MNSIHMRCTVRSNIIFIVVGHRRWAKIGSLMLGESNASTLPNSPFIPPSALEDTPPSNSPSSTFHSFTALAGLDLITGFPPPRSLVSSCFVSFDEQVLVRIE